MDYAISATIERWFVDGAFTISRGAKTYVDVVLCMISDGINTGVGEATPIYYEGETAKQCVDDISTFAANNRNFNGTDIATKMPRGAARNAIDTALWDYYAVKTNEALWKLAKLPQPRALTTAFTISLDSPSRMETNARDAATNHSLLKVKLCGDNDRARVAAVRRGAPEARLIVDANESWDDLDIAAEANALANLGVELIEQPVSAGRDHLLDAVQSAVLFCADESCHSSRDVERIAPYYDAVNIKLDKAGGLTEAIKLADKAEAHGLKLMVGCMLSTSLAIRPAFALAQRAQWVDLDGPLLLADDRPNGFHFNNGQISIPESNRTAAS